MSHYSGEEHVNVGCGSDVTIKELAALVADVIGLNGKIVTDSSKPDGTPRKLLDVSTLVNLGWRPQIALREGVAQTYRWYLDNVDTLGTSASKHQLEQTE